MLMQAACQNMGWRIRGQWCVIPPESFRTGKKEVLWYLQLLLDSNFLPSCYFWEKRQGYLASFFLTNILSWGNLILLKGQDVSMENFTPLQRLQRAASSLMSGDPSLSPSFFIPLLLTHLSFTALLPLESKGTPSTPHQQLSFVPGVAVSLFPVLGTPWCSDLWKRSRAAVSDVRIALAPNCTGESLSGQLCLWNSSGVTHC